MLRLEIFDLIGKMIRVFDNPNVAVSLVDLDPGIYLLNYTLETNQKFTYKIQKQ